MNTRVALAPVPSRAPEVITDHWMAALKYLAIGRTANDLRDEAGDPQWVKGLALLSGTTPDGERGQLLRIADAVAELKAEGLTPVKCWYLSGLDQFHGPYPGDDAPMAA